MTYEEMCDFAADFGLFGEMFMACQPLLLLDRQLESRIYALCPESYVQSFRAFLEPADWRDSNDLVLWDGRWEEEIPF